MSGNHIMWTLENRAKAAARMAARWADPAYRQRQSEIRRRTMADPKRRAEKSALMRSLNERMKTDVLLKAANLTGIYRAYAKPDRRRAVGERVKRDWQRDPARRERQRQIAHATASKAAKARLRKLRGPMPAGFEDLYQVLVRKVGMAEAMRIVRAEAARGKAELR